MKKYANAILIEKPKDENGLTTITVEDMAKFIFGGMDASKKYVFITVEGDNTTAIGFMDAEKHKTLTEWKYGNGLTKMDDYTALVRTTINNTERKNYTPEALIDYEQIGFGQDFVTNFFAARR